MCKKGNKLFKRMINPVTELCLYLIYEQTMIYAKTRVIIILLGRTHEILYSNPYRFGPMTCEHLSSKVNILHNEVIVCYL